MAVQKSKKSSSKRDMRRSHNALQDKSLSEDKQTGEIHLRHHLSADGYYKGKQIIKSAQIETDKEDSVT